MKQIYLAAALALAPVAAQAAPADPWIVITVGPPLPEIPAVSTALISTEHFPDVTTCAVQKGQVEGVLLVRFPKERYLVWCAYVPGLGP